MTKRKSILPLQPIVGSPKSGIMPMSGNTASVVEVLELASADPLPVELPEVVDEPPLVEVDSPEVVSGGRVVVAGVVKPDDAASGPPQAANPAAKTATASRGAAMDAQSSAKPRRDQVGRRWPCGMPAAKITGSDVIMV